MGNNCCAVDTISRPDVQCGQNDDITLERPIRYATFGPEKRHAHDVTQSVRNLFAQGHTRITGGITSAIGDPFPNQEKLFKVWYLPEKPDDEWNDGEEVELKGIVSFATYGPVGAAEDGEPHSDDSDGSAAAPPPQDVTEAIVALQKKGRNEFSTGIQAHIGDAFPGKKKTFKVWYSA